MTRILAGISAVLAIVAGLLYMRLDTMEDQMLTLTHKVSEVKSALETEKRLRTADNKALSSRISAAEKARLDKVKSDEATTKALADNPTWAGQRVPDDVIDAIGM